MIGVVILAPFMTQMDSTIVNVSLTAIEHDLGATTTSAHWIISAYLLALALMLPIHGWLVDRLGAKKLYLLCFSSFTLASVLCGFARTLPELIAARIFQGMAGGLLAPLAQFMLVRIAGKQMARVVGYASAPILLAPLLGPLLAGVILKYAGWRWLFYVNVPVGVMAVILAWKIIPHEDSSSARRPFDLLGFLTLSPALSLTLYGFEQSLHGEGWPFLGAGLALFILFFVRMGNFKGATLIDLTLFRIPTFRVATITQFFANGIIYAGQFLFPLFLMKGFGLKPQDAGWILAAMGLGMFTVYPLMGRLTDKFGCRPVAASGVLLNFIGTLPFLGMAFGELSVPLAVAGLILRGIGQGATGIPSVTAAYAAVPKDKLSSATTALNILQRLGGPIITTVMGVVVSFAESHPKATPAANFAMPFIALIVIQLIVLGSAWRLPMRIESTRE